jgi:hypothetical protein
MIPAPARDRAGIAGFLPTEGSFLSDREWGPEETAMASPHSFVLGEPGGFSRACSPATLGPALSESFSWEGHDPGLLAPVHPPKLFPQAGHGAVLPRAGALLPFDSNHPDLPEDFFDGRSKAMPRPDPSFDPCPGAAPSLEHKFNQLDAWAEELNKTARKELIVLWLLRGPAYLSLVGLVPAFWAGWVGLCVVFLAVFGLGFLIEKDYPVGRLRRAHHNAFSELRSLLVRMKDEWLTGNLRGRAKLQTIAARTIDGLQDDVERIKIEVQEAEALVGQSKLKDLGDQLFRTLKAAWEMVSAFFR